MLSIRFSLAKDNKPIQIIYTTRQGIHEFPVLE